jgi:arabinogalactan endo-1,4-beta-galactosidase
VTASEYWAERTLFYLGKMFTDQLKPGEDYQKLEKCIHIGILNFTMFEDEEYYSCFHFWSDQGRKMYSDKVEIHTLELPKLAKYEYPETELLKWLQFINAETKEEFEMAAEKSEYIKKANEDFSGLAGLLESAISGVRASAASSTKIMLHLDQGGKNQLYTWYFGGLLKESPNLDFDVFGLSYYPMWHGTMEGLQYNLNYLATTYNKEVCVVETAYAWTTEDGDGEGNVFISGDEEVGGYPATVEGQFEFMNDLESIILNVPDDKGIGYFYWEPEWIPVEGGTYATSAGVAYKNDTVTPSNTWDNMTLFNFQGNALDSIKVLNKPCENLLTNISFEQNGITTSPSGWNVWTSDSSDENTVRTEYGDAYDGDYKLTFWDDKEYSCSVYKTYTNIPNGTYKFSIWAKTNGKQDVLQLYAKNYGGSELDTTIETSDINWNIFSIDKIVVTNHTLEIGVYSVAGANDWCNLDLAMLRKID